IPGAVGSAVILPFFFSSRRRHTRSKRDWSSDVCSSDLTRRGGRKYGLGLALKAAAHLFCQPQRRACRNGQAFVGALGQGRNFIRSEERRVGKEWGCRGAAGHLN